MYHNQTVAKYLRAFVYMLVLYTSLFCLKAQSDPSYTISGYVLDLESKETLIGATIYAPEVQQGVYTNAHGFYSLTLKQPISKLIISYVGYQSYEKAIANATNQKYDISLTPITQLEEIVVTAQERGQMRKHLAGALELPTQIIKATPTLLGESDLMKALQLTPGVKSGADGSAGIHVRGGGPDENLILLDGVPLYNVDHLMGFFSVFTPEAVKKVDLYKGSFPARYGGRLSSVVDVRTNDGNLERYKGTLSIGLISAKAQLEGPIIKDKTSFNISARRSYIDVLMQPFLGEDEKGGLYFYDLNAKIQHRLGKRDRLYLSLYHGLDKFHGKSEETYNGKTSVYSGAMHWGNSLLSLRWNHIFNHKLYSDLSLSYTRYHFTFYNKYSGVNEEHQGVETTSDYNSGIRDLRAQLNFQYSLSPRQEFRFGGEYLLHKFEPESYGYSERGQTTITEEQRLALNRHNRHIQAHDASLYLESRSQIGKNILLNLGLRANAFGVDNKTYLSLQPRADLDLRLSPRLSTQLAYAHMEQHVHLLTSGVTLPTDLWVPTTKHIKPMYSDQISLGAKYDIAKGWSLNAELYYKQMNNIIEYKDGASTIGNSQSWEDKVEMGRGRAYGLELMLLKTSGKTQGWIGYTLARSERHFPDGTINQGKWFPYKYDRRHHLNIVLTHKISRRIDLSASWEYYTGGVITLGLERQHILTPSGDGTQSIGIVRYIPGRNNYRMPATHRLNLSVNHNRFHKNGAKSIWNFSIFNVYNQKNPSFLLPETYWYDGEGSTPKINKFTLLPLIPSLSYTYKF